MSLICKVQNSHGQITLLWSWMEIRTIVGNRRHSSNGLYLYLSYAFIMYTNLQIIHDWINPFKHVSARIGCFDGKVYSLININSWHIHMSYFGVISTPVLDFWWHPFWVSKPGCSASLALRSRMCYMLPTYWRSVSILGQQFKMIAQHCQLLVHPQALAWNLAPGHIHRSSLH